LDDAPGAAGDKTEASLEDGGRRLRCGRRKTRSEEEKAGDYWGVGLIPALVLAVLIAGSDVWVRKSMESAVEDRVKSLIHEKWPAPNSGNKPGFTPKRMYGQ